LRLGIYKEDYFYNSSFQSRVAVLENFPVENKGEDTKLVLRKLYGFLKIIKCISNRYQNLRIANLTPIDIYDTILSSAS